MQCSVHHVSMSSLPAMASLTHDMTPDAFFAGAMLCIQAMVSSVKALSLWTCAKKPALLSWVPNQTPCGCSVESMMPELLLKMLKYQSWQASKLNHNRSAVVACCALALAHQGSTKA